MIAEIEIHEAHTKGRHIYVDYTIYDGETTTNVYQQLKMFDVLEYIKTEAINMGSFIKSDKDIDDYYFNPAKLLFNYLSDIVKIYLEGKLCA